MTSPKSGLQPATMPQTTSNSTEPIPPSPNGSTFLGFSKKTWTILIATFALIVLLQVGNLALQASPSFKEAVCTGNSTIASSNSAITAQLNELAAALKVIQAALPAVGSRRRRG